MVCCANLVFVHCFNIKSYCVWSSLMLWSLGFYNCYTLPPSQQHSFLFFFPFPSFSNFPKLVFYYVCLSFHPPESSVTPFFLASPFLTLPAPCRRINLSSCFLFLAHSFPKEIRMTCDGILTLSCTIRSLHLPLNRLTHIQNHTHTHVTHSFKHTCHTGSNSRHTLGCLVNAALFPSPALLIPVKKSVCLCVTLWVVFVVCVISSCWLTSVNVALSLTVQPSLPLPEISLCFSLVPASSVPYCV